MAKQILVVDDEESIRSTLKASLMDEGFRVATASSGLEALDALRATRYDTVILDVWMPGIDGLETLKLIKAEWPQQSVIVMSGHGNIETAVRATKFGAYDFVEKPLSLERILVTLQNIAGVQDLARENQALRKQVDKQRGIIGESSAMRTIQDMIKRVAPTSGSVLITGENGTGKEVVAQTLHSLSPRYGKPFVEVNCAAIPEELIESELFGHEKGSFTGATQQRRGKFDLAHGGTLFLDEIGDMSLKTQAKVLRVLQEQKFERVGGTQTTSVDVRVIAATNKDLKQEIQKGQFREDLFYRLNVIPFLIPALRERAEDIPLLAAHFMREASLIHGKPPRQISPQALKVLTAYRWPGNVRELKNLIERIVILATEDDTQRPVGVSEILQHLQDEALTLQYGSQIEGDFEVQARGAKTATKNLKDARHEFEKDFILRILKENEWNVSRTAEVLGVERSHLHRKIKGFGIQHPLED